MPLQGNTHACTFLLVQWRSSWGPDKTNTGHTLFIIVTINVVTFHSYIYSFFAMVNRRAPTPMSKGTSGSSDANALTEMCVTMDELHCHNQALKDDFHIIRQHQQDSNPS